MTRAMSAPTFGTHMAGMRVAGSQRLIKYMFVHVAISCRISAEATKRYERISSTAAATQTTPPQRVTRQLTRRIRRHPFLDVLSNGEDESDDQPKAHACDRCVEDELQVAVTEAAAAATKFQASACMYTQLHTSVLEAHPSKI